MASLQKNLQRLQEIAANPKAQLDRYLKSGRQVVGCFPIYTPEVLADAAGLVPMGHVGQRRRSFPWRKSIWFPSLPHHAVLHGAGARR